MSGPGRGASLRPASPAPDGRPRAPRDRLRRAIGAARDILWGLALYDSYHEMMVEAQRHRDAFDVLILGEMLGIPLMNTTIGLRLLPYAVGDLHGFRVRFLREHEVLEQAPHIH